MTKREIAYFLHIHPVDKERLEILKKQEKIDSEDLGKIAAKSEIYSGWYVVCSDGTAERENREALHKDILRHTIVHANICFRKAETLDSLSHSTELEVLRIEDAPAKLPKKLHVLQDYGLRTIRQTRGFFGRKEYHIEGIAGILHKD